MRSSTLLFNACLVTGMFWFEVIAEAQREMLDIALGAPRVR
jgi:hypothetical protein